jgi:threonine/homoserine/homoserine lactone efflux protein
MLLDLFLIGLVVSLEPIPLTAMILLLASERGLWKGLGFTLGWLLTLVVIVAVTVLVTGGKPLVAHSSPSTAALAVKLACGVVLVLSAGRRRARPARTVPKKEPKWMSGIDRIGPLAAAGLGFLLQPWVLVTAGVATITQAELSSGLEYFAVFAFCIWCTASYLVMESYAAVRPAQVKSTLDGVLHWINTHTDQAIVFLSLGLGRYLMAKSIYGLVS